MKNRKRRMVSWITALLILCQTGCGFFSVTPQGEAEGESSYTYAEDESELIVVGFSQVGSESVWRTAHSNSIQNALTKENGYFLIFDNARQKQENQIKAIRSFISQRVDYIVLSPIVESGWDTVLKEAKDAGIPVIIMDRRVDADASLYTTWVGTDTYKEGENAARWLEGELKSHNALYEDVNIVILQGTLGSSAESNRTRGFASIAQRYGNWHILDQQTGDFTVAKGKEVMQQFLKKYDDIDVVVAQNDDMAFGAIEAIEEAGKTTGVGKDMILISFDAVREALVLVQQGKINVDIECNPEQGDDVEKVIRMLENGESVEKEYVVAERIFTHRNVARYIEERTY